MGFLGLLRLNKSFVTHSLNLLFRLKPHFSFPFWVLHFKLIELLWLLKNLKLQILRRQTLLNTLLKLGQVTLWQFVREKLRCCLKHHRFLTFTQLLLPWIDFVWQDLYLVFIFDDFSTCCRLFCQWLIINLSQLRTKRVNSWLDYSYLWLDFLKLSLLLCGLIWILHFGNDRQMH